MRDFDELTGPPELVQGRLRLRALRADDKASVVAALNDPLAGRFLWRPPFPYAGSDFGVSSTPLRTRYAITSLPATRWPSPSSIAVASMSRRYTAASIAS